MPKFFSLILWIMRLLSKKDGKELDSGDPKQLDLDLFQNVT